MIKRCIENFINGNLTDAKNQAICLKIQSLYNSMRNYYGWSHEKAYATAQYLKHPSNESFQAACNAK